jgi:hypothetical protein
VKFGNLAHSRRRGLHLRSALIEQLQRSAQWFDDLEQTGFERAAGRSASRESLGGEPAKRCFEVCGESPWLERSDDLFSRARTRRGASSVEQRAEVPLLFFADRLSFGARPPT